MIGWVVLGLLAIGLVSVVLGFQAADEPGQSADVRIGGAGLIFTGGLLGVIGFALLVGAGIWSLM